MQPTIDSFFAKTVCINLDRRPERWSSMRHKFAKQGITTVERLAAVDSRFSPVPEHLSHLRAQDYACTMSHLAAVKLAKAAGLPNILIFEDDAFFDPDFHTQFPRFIAQVPPDWDMLFLGAYHFAEPIPVAPNIVRAVKALTTHAYAIRGSLFDAYIAINSSPPAIVDRNNVALQQQFACYCLEPNLVGQEAGYSDVMEEDMPLKPLTYPSPAQGTW